MTTIRLGARIRAARKAAGFHTAKEFLKKYKLPASTLSQHESGARIPDDEALKYYCKIFGVDFDWLKAGKGLPFKHLTQDKKETMDEELVNLTQSHLNQELLVEIFEKLFRAHKIDISDHALKSISKEGIRIYKNIISSSASEKMQKKMLKSAFAAYR